MYIYTVNPRILAQGFHFLANAKPCMGVYLMGGGLLFKGGGGEKLLA